MEKYAIFDGFGEEKITPKLFFEVIREFDDTMKANLVFFFTG